MRTLLLMAMLAAPLLAQGRPIQSVQVETPALLRAGGAIAVTMQAVPGGLADFDLGWHRNVPMAEGPPGQYRGSFLLAPGEQFSSRVLVRWSGADGLLDSFLSVQVYTVEGPGPRLINWADAAALSPGLPLDVHMTGTPGGQAFLDAGGQVDMPMTELTPGMYAGSAFSPGARVLIHLRLPDGRQDTLEVPARASAER